MLIPRIVRGDGIVHAVSNNGIKTESNKIFVCVRQVGLYLLSA
jgi:hypothetical protein